VQVRELARYLRAQQAQRTERLPLQAATVVRVQQTGMGDRACVDLCR
jgi:3-dehydroquinate synthase class II